MCTIYVVARAASSALGARAMGACGDRRVPIARPIPRDESL